MNSRLGWLKCIVEEGMFDSERSVMSQTSEGKKFSLYVNFNVVRDPQKSGDNMIRVTVYETHEKSSVIMLPSDPFETSKMVNVDNEQLEFATA